MNSIEKLIDDITQMRNKGIIVNSLSQIKMNSFRKFEEGAKLDFTFPLTVIVGKNGSGKTTVMKAIEVLGTQMRHQDEFFEIPIDDGGYQNADISYRFAGETIRYTRIRPNVWNREGKYTEQPKITYIQPKRMIGAIEKSFLYDGSTRNPSRPQMVDYLNRQTKKILQNTHVSSKRKESHRLSELSIEQFNFILQENVQSAEVIRHKFFSGTFGTSILFNDGKQYSEYNAGSGEFLVASVIDRVDRIPNGSILLLDEPEVSLHPGAQKRLVLYILEMIKRKKLQVILTTHSPYIIEGLPKESIKCFRKQESGIITIQEQVYFANAFLELEAKLPDKKHIIVEDALSKKILDKILQEVGLEEMLSVEFYPGGADNIKKYTIFTYAKTGISNRFVLLDGDQRKDTIPDLLRIPEVDKTIDYLMRLFKSVVGIDAKTITWGEDANRRDGRRNEDQVRALILGYLQYFDSNVFFLPQQIPEDIIYDEERLKRYLGENGIPDVSQEGNSKKKLKRIADEARVSIVDLENYLIYWFVKSKNADYQEVFRLLKHIIES